MLFHPPGPPGNDGHLLAWPHLYFTFRSAGIAAQNARPAGRGPEPVAGRDAGNTMQRRLPRSLRVTVCRVVAAWPLPSAGPGNVPDVPPLPGGPDAAAGPRRRAPVGGRVRPSKARRWRVLPGRTANPSVTIAGPRKSSK
ncbi:hypothetical protein Acsp04_47950 [Actinomadura sp. NBRC 104425]|nr:hypothetical protein Acsp04_47950 [Actinomadura sp. NBRC 104425]